jgi:SAM-dependent methyltransferase
VSDLNNDYYQHNAGMFFADTGDVDMTLLYRRFLPLLPEAAHVLDAGCGSGRDALAFARRGHRVTAFDASPRPW